MNVMNMKQEHENEHEVTRTRMSVWATVEVNRKYEMSLWATVISSPQDFIHIVKEVINLNRYAILCTLAIVSLLSAFPGKMQVGLHRQPCLWRNRDHEIGFFHK